jgi:ribosome-binding factor A
MKKYPRQVRLSSLIKEEISLLIQREMKNPQVGFVTVLRVDVAKDLKSCKVFVSLYGDKKTERFKALRRCTPFFQKRLGERLHLKYIPRLNFFLQNDVLEG